jgi:hypothetical protein
MNIDSMHKCECPWCPFSKEKNKCYPKIKMTILLTQREPDIEMKRNFNLSTIIQLLISIASLLFIRIHQMNFKPIRVRVTHEKFFVVCLSKFLPQVHVQLDTDGPDAVPFAFSSILFPEQNAGACVLPRA